MSPILSSAAPGRSIPGLVGQVPRLTLGPEEPAVPAGVVGVGVSAYRDEPLNLGRFASITPVI